MKWHTKNRLLAFLLVFVFAFGLAACNGNDAGANDTATTPAATDTVGDAADATADTVGAAADATAGAVGDAADATAGAVNAAADTVADTGGAAADAAAAAVGDVNAAVVDARNQAVSDLQALDLSDEAETNVLAVQSTLTQVRDNLSTAFANADEAAQAEWEALQPQFDEAEAALQDNAAEGLQQVQALLERLQQDVAQ